MKKFQWGLFIFCAVCIGLYPATYLLFDMSQGLLSSKPAEVLTNSYWKFQFYQHIIFGGVALLVGWWQFSKKWRMKYLNTHRLFGKIYFFAVILSGFAGLYLAFYATGGLIASLGFGSLAVLWLFTTVRAYISIRKKDIIAHEHWMIRSYALTFAAVTLRIWLPLFQFGFGMKFMDSYLVIAWLCWVPNLLVAEWIVQNKLHTQKVL
jgi:hypothetical protein